VAQPVALGESVEIIDTMMMRFLFRMSIRALRVFMFPMVDIHLLDLPYVVLVCEEEGEARRN
jgi:hypothetical protein